MLSVCLIGLCWLKKEAVQDECNGRASSSTAHTVEDVHCEFVAIEIISIATKSSVQSSMMWLQ